MNSELRKCKLAIITALLGLAVSVYLSRYSYSASIITLTTVLTGIVLLNRNDSKFYFSLFIIILVLLRVFVYVSTPSMVGMDADKVAVGVQRIMAFSTLSSISQIPFYSVAAAFHVLGATAGLLFDMNARYSLFIVPIYLTTVPSLAAMAIAKRLNFRGLVAGIITAVASILAAWSLQPVPQALASALIPVLFLSLVLYLGSQRSTYQVPIYIFVLSLMLSHKIPLFYVLLVLGLAVIISKDRKIVMTLSLIIGVALCFQAIFLTDFLWGLINVVLLPSITGARIPTTELENITMASPVLGGLFGGIIKNLHWLLLCSLSGIGWLIFTRYWLEKKDSSATLIMSVGVASGMFVVVSVVGPYIASPRVLLMTAAPFAIFQEPIVSKLSEYRVGIFTALLVCIQITAPVATPDHPAQYRQYLTEEEVHAKSTIDGFTDIVQTDGYYARELSSIDTSRTYITGSSNASQAGWGDLGLALYNMEMANVSDPIVTRNITQYRLEGTWILNYSPEIYLKQSRHMVYDSGNVKLFISN